MVLDGWFHYGETSVSIDATDGKDYFTSDRYMVQYDKELRQFIITFAIATDIPVRDDYKFTVKLKSWGASIYCAYSLNVGIYDQKIAGQNGP